MSCCAMLSKWLSGYGGESLVGLLRGTAAEMKQTTNLIMLSLRLEKLLPKMAVPQLYYLRVPRLGAALAI